MAGTIQCGRRSRRDFGKIPSIVEIPNLIEVQKRSYETFLQKDVASDRREENGLQAVFKSVFPISDYNDNAMLEFDSYHFGEPKYTVDECHDRGMTFAIPLKVTLRLVVFDHDKEAKTRTIREQRGQEVYLGELPLMTDKGTFIINGTERVVVSQLQRSAGVFFDDDKGKTLASGKPLYLGARHSLPRLLGRVRLRRQRPAPRAGGPPAQDVRHGLPARVLVPREEHHPLRRGDPRPVLRHRRGAELRGRQRLAEAASRGLSGRQGRPTTSRRPRHREALVTAGKVLNAKLVEKLVEASVEKIPVRAEALVGRRTATRIVDTETGEVLLASQRGDHVHRAGPAHGRKVSTFKLLVLAPGKVDASIYETLARDHVKNPDEALVEIYRKLRPGDPPTVESARALFRGMFMDAAPLRPGPGRPLHDQQEAADRRAASHQDAAQRGHRLGRPAPADGQAGQQGHRRHRPPRQPPRALGRRAAARTSSGSASRGWSGRSRSGCRSRDITNLMPARPDQRQAGLGGDQGVLRLVAAVAVHGPDEPAGRADPQAAAVGPRVRAV